METNLGYGFGMYVCYIRYRRFDHDDHLGLVGNYDLYSPYDRFDRYGLFDHLDSLVFLIDSLIDHQIIVQVYRTIDHLSVQSIVVLGVRHLALVV